MFNANELAALAAVATALDNLAEVELELDTPKVTIADRDDDGRLRSKGYFLHQNGEWRLYTEGQAHEDLRAPAKPAEARTSAGVPGCAARAVDVHVEITAPSNGAHGSPSAGCCS